MLLLWICCCLLLGPIYGVLGAAVVVEKMPKSTAPTPAPIEITPRDGYLQDTPVHIAPDRAKLNARVITAIEFVTTTVTAQSTPSISYAKRDGKTDSWIEVDHGKHLGVLEPFSKRRGKRATEVEDAGLDGGPCLIPPCPTVTHTSTVTVPIPTDLPVQNCMPTDPAYKLLFFDDYFNKDSISTDEPTLSNEEPLPPTDSFTYYGVNFNGNFSFLHCEANHLPFEDPRVSVCNRKTREGAYYLALYSPVSPAPAKAPVRRTITFTGRYFHLHSMLISAFPVPQGISGGAGVVSVIIKGYTSDPGPGGTIKPAFTDVRYIIGGAGGGGEARLKILYGLNFFYLVKLEVIAVEGEWKAADGEDWGASKWKGRGAPLYIDDLAVCKYF